LTTHVLSRLAHREPLSQNVIYDFGHAFVGTPGALLEPLKDVRFYRDLKDSLTDVNLILSRFEILLIVHRAVGIPKFPYRFLCGKGL
jgi:hypothetical protein